MKNPFSRVITPAAFAIVAVMACYYLGKAHEEEVNKADAAEEAATDFAGKVSTHNTPEPPRYIATADAKRRLKDILAGVLPAGEKGQLEAVRHLLDKVRPADAVQMAIHDLPDGWDDGYVIRRTLTNWVDADPKAALDWISGLDADSEETQLEKYLTKVPSTLAARYVDKLTDAAARDKLIASIASDWAQTDPQNALTWLGQKTTGDNYAKTFTNIFRALAGQPTEADVAFVNDGTAGSVNDKYGPEAAAALLENVTDPALRTKAIYVITDGWTHSEPQAALKWAAGLPDADSDARASALNTIVAMLVKFDPTATATMVQQSGNPSLFLPDAPAIADSLSKYDAQGALNFVQSLPDGATKDQAVNNVLMNLAGTDFSTAWNFANTLPAGAGRDAAMGSLLGTQAKMDPAKAVTLLDQFTDDAALQNATQTLAKTWAAQDPQAASVWMQAMPLGTQRNVAVVELITAQVGKDPATTLQWANTITTDTTRANQVQRIVTSWAKTDPAAALNALQSANITDDQRAAFTQIINQAQAKAK